MDMQMHDRLTGSRAIVDPDIESVGQSVIQNWIKQFLAHFRKQAENCGLFLSGCLKERADVPFRYDQGVSGSDGETIKQGDRVFIGNDDIGDIWMTEGTGGLIYFIDHNFLAAVDNSKNVTGMQSVVDGHSNQYFAGVERFIRLGRIGI